MSNLSNFGSQVCTKYIFAVIIQLKKIKSGAKSRRSDQYGTFSEYVLWPDSSGFMDGHDLWKIHGDPGFFRI